MGIDQTANTKRRLFGYVIATLVAAAGGAANHVFALTAKEHDLLLAATVILVVPSLLIWTERVPHAIREGRLMARLGIAEHGDEIRAELERAHHAIDAQEHRSERALDGVLAFLGILFLLSLIDLIVLHQFNLVSHFLFTRPLRHHTEEIITTGALGVAIATVSLLRYNLYRVGMTSKDHADDCAPSD